jgi:hypothetical protein
MRNGRLSALHKAPAVVAFCLAACRPDGPTPTEGGGESTPSMSYLSRAGAVQPIDLPAIDIDQPATPLPIETDDAALTSAIAAAGNLAWIGFKDVSSPRQNQLRRAAPHPFKRGQVITTSRRPPLPAVASRRGLAAVEKLGGAILEYYEQLGFAMVRIDPLTAPAIAADSSVDWIEPVSRTGSAANGVG